MWNYRVIKQEDGTLAIHEVYYEGKRPSGWSEGCATPVADDLEGLKFTLEAMLVALDKPTLKVDLKTNSLVEDKEEKYV